MIRITRPSAPVLPAGSVLAEYDARHPKWLARDEATMPEEERALAGSIRSAPRRTGFIAGRLALHAALAESDARAHAARPVLRDARGRPAPTWDGAPPISIAHSRSRAVAAVAPDGSCAAIGIDVEEIDAHRAHALVRMSLSPAEVELVRASDAELVVGPIAIWCAREACVKAHALEVGWFGTALVARRFEPCDVPIEPSASAPASDHAAKHAPNRAWRIEIAFEGGAIFQATAWAGTDVAYAAAVRA